MDLGKLRNLFGRSRFVLSHRATFLNSPCFYSRSDQKTRGGRVPGKKRVAAGAKMAQKATAAGPLTNDNECV